MLSPCYLRAKPALQGARSPSKKKIKLFEFKGLPEQGNEYIIASIENEARKKPSVFKEIAVLASCFLKELYMFEIAVSGSRAFEAE